MEKKQRKKRPGDPGRPTELTDELIKQIKQCVFDGKNLKEIADICKINEGTFYVWHSDNYLKLADKIEGWRRDRKLNLAEGVLEEMLTIPVQTLQWQGRGENSEQVVVTDPALVRVKQDTAKFVAETLGKDTYSKRSELTGKNGSDLMPKNMAEFLHQTCADDTTRNKDKVKGQKLPS